MTNQITQTAQVPLETLREGLRKRPIVETSNVRVAEFFFDQGTNTQPHSHDVEQASYIVSGRFEVNLDGEVVELRAGDGYSIAANLQHSVVCNEAGSYVLASVLKTAQEAQEQDHGHGHGHGHDH